MTERSLGSEYWSEYARDRTRWRKPDELLSEQYRRVHLELLASWADLGLCQAILKTDLFAEALQPSRAFLWPLLGNTSRVVGLDISFDLAAQAKDNAAQYAPQSHGCFAACDVRRLPFASNTFDLIVSDSTLDHFRHKSDIRLAILELARILKPGGTLVITMDNKNNLTEPLFRLWIRLGLNDFFIGKTYSVRELRRALARAGLEVTQTTVIIHNPRLFTHRLIGLLRSVDPERFNKWIRRGLRMLDALDGSPTKYLTAQFIATRALKPQE